MKNVLLIITGSIAAPKALNLYNLLKNNYHVSVILTSSANRFVKLPKNIKTYEKLFDKTFYKKQDNITHTNIALNHDLIIVYPATMNFISKAALAIPDNLALATFLASAQPKIIFPAMNNNMYLNNSFQNNLHILQQDANVNIIEPDYGTLACKIEGIGRVKEPEIAFNIIEDIFNKNQGLVNKTILINYGSMRTYLDDIRYITNNSSGKMGQAFVNACLQQQAKVIAIIGDILVPLVNDKNLTVIKANNNKDMLKEMEKYYQQADIVFCVAALNDYLLEQKINGKISKTKNPNLTLNLIPNIDVLKTLGTKKKKQILIGFSAQDDENDIIGKNKMKEKNCDGIIINHIKTMGEDKSQVTFYFNDLSYNLCGTKKQIAQDVINIIVQLINKE